VGLGSDGSTFAVERVYHRHVVASSLGRRQIAGSERASAGKSGVVHAVRRVVSNSFFGAPSAGTEPCSGDSSADSPNDSRRRTTKRSAFVFASASADATVGRGNRSASGPESLQARIAARSTRRVRIVRRSSIRFPGGWSGSSGIGSEARSRAGSSGSAGWLTKRAARGSGHDSALPAIVDRRETCGQQYRAVAASAGHLEAIVVATEGGERVGITGVLTPRRCATLGQQYADTGRGGAPCSRASVAARSTVPARRAAPPRPRSRGDRVRACERASGASHVRVAAARTAPRSPPRCSRR